MKKNNKGIKKNQSKKVTSNKNDNNNIFIGIIMVIILLIILFLPKIYNLIENSNLPKVEQSEKDKTTEIKKVDEETLKSIHFPIMRNSAYDINTYYNLDEFTISNMSNNDILYNAFMDLYEGNIVNSNTQGTCTLESKQFDVDYIDLRIKNILGKNINYSLQDFYVPEDSNNKYVGTWSYEGGIFKYNGLCTSKVTSIKYYNLEQFIKAEYENKDIIVYYYVGFAKVEGNNYFIYNDANMTKQLQTGIFTNVNELNTLFESLNNNSKKIYKYTFKNNLCSYDEYCLYKGEWVNEL